MLGREFTVKASNPKDGTFGLLSPEGNGVIWIPAGAVELKISVDLPIDKYLDLGLKELNSYYADKTLKEKNKFKEVLQRPFSAYHRPVKHPEDDSTITKQRMGYFICFDISDPDGESLREAMALHQMLIKSLDKKAQHRCRPKIWLVACKSDCSRDA